MFITIGIHCETPHCPALYCLNGGTCNTVNHRWQSKGLLGRDLLNCTCPPGFTGSRCEHRIRNPSNPVKLRHRQHRSDSADLAKVFYKLKKKFNFLRLLKGTLASIFSGRRDATEQNNGQRCRTNGSALRFQPVSQRRPLCRQLSRLPRFLHLPLPARVSRYGNLRL